MGGGFTPMALGVRSGRSRIWTNRASCSIRRVSAVVWKVKRVGFQRLRMAA
jgi:hypothetical protein